MLKLNLGSGHRRYPGFLNVDMESGTNPNFVLDIGRDPWPFDDNSVEEAKLIHVLEHIGPSTEAHFHVVKELYRVSAPGAVTEVVIPHLRHDVFWNDQTHVKMVTHRQMCHYSRKFLADNQRTPEQARQMYGTDKAISMFTPFAEYLGVDFDVGNPRYVLDHYNLQMYPEFYEKVKEDPQFYERFYTNIVLEVQFAMRAVK